MENRFQNIIENMIQNRIESENNITTLNAEFTFTPDTVFTDFEVKMKAFNDNTFETVDITVYGFLTASGKIDITTISQN